MAMKLYVGNLSHQMTEEQLNALFSEAGHVASAKIITDRQTGQPRGFAFVEMETKLEGQKAISMLNGREVDGRPWPSTKPGRSRKAPLAGAAAVTAKPRVKAASGPPFLCRGSRSSFSQVRKFIFIADKPDLGTAYNFSDEMVIFSGLILEFFGGINYLIKFSP